VQKAKAIVVLLVLATGILAAPDLAFAQVQLDAQNDEYFVNEDITLIDPIGVLQNDTIPEGETITALLKTEVGFGVLTLNSDGSFSYTPFANFASTDSFTYVISNGVDESNEATVTINVNPVNDVPVTEDDEYSTLEDTALTITIPGVLENDTDAENDSLSAILDSTTSNGVLVLNSDGSFEYTPNNDFVGTDLFSYHANDGTDDGSIGTVTIEVNQDFNSIIDSILEQIQMLFDKIFVIEDDVSELKEQNALLESRVTELEAKISSGSSDDDVSELKEQNALLESRVTELEAKISSGSSDDDVSVPSFA